MGCLLTIVALAMPRGLLFFAWLLTDWPQRAFKTTVWPLLGFFLMPYATVAYMTAMLQNDNQLSGWWLVLFVFAVLCDLGSHGSSTRNKKER